MEKYFEIIAQTRTNFIQLLDGLTIEQVNKIPAGFNNNIIWNFAHAISAQQVLCYRLAGISPVVDENFIELFKKGTKPEAFIDQNKLNHIKKLSELTIEKLKLDYSDKVFTNYTDYTTSYNVSLSSIDDAIKFVSVHDGLHFGYAMALRRLV
ncbi:DinB family protein [soil metagenome]